jgi:hypothetical protein
MKPSSSSHLSSSLSGYARLVFIIFTLCTACNTAIAQKTEKKYLYVNTDNLILRDRPEPFYKVYAILHAPCRVQLLDFRPEYKNYKNATTRFYDVRLKYTDEKRITYTFDGFVDKRYIVAHDSLITAYVKEEEKNLETNATVVDLIPYFGPEEDSPNPENARNFPPPKYKGGEKTFVSRNSSTAIKRIYHLGPKEGCYYINSKGNKTYVDKKYCKGLK